MRHKDKLMHFAAGFAVSVLPALISPTLGLAAACAAGWLKEEYDRKRPHAHTRDGWDCAATCAGALPSLAVYEVVHRYLGLSWDSIRSLLA